jgi:hypothetical protein
MKYKIVKYKKKNKCPFETYEPKKRIKINKGQAVPILMRLRDLGGAIGFWISSCLIAASGFFGIKKKVNNFRSNKKTIEFRIKKH